MQELGIYWHLKNFDLFANVPQENLMAISKKMIHRPLKKGEIVYAEGDVNKEVFLVKGGRIKLLHANDDISDTIVELLQDGDVFGKLGTYETGKKSEETARVITDDALVCSITSENVEHFMQQIPQLAINYANMLAQKLQQVEMKYSLFLKKDIRKRLLEFFVMHSQYEGKKTERGIEISSFLTHQEIANFIGTSRQTVTTLINEMEHKKLLLILEKGTILIPDLQLLKH